MRGFLVRWAIGALALWVASAIVPGMEIHGVSNFLLAALLLGLVNAIVRPIVLVLTLPLTIVTLGHFSPGRERPHAQDRVLVLRSAALSELRIRDHRSDRRLPRELAHVILDRTRGNFRDARGAPARTLVNSIFARPEWPGWRRRRRTSGFEPLLETPQSAGPPHPVQGARSPRTPTWHRLELGLLC